METRSTYSNLVSRWPSPLGPKREKKGKEKGKKTKIRGETWNSLKHGESGRRDLGDVNGSCVILGNSVPLSGSHCT